MSDDRRTPSVRQGGLLLSALLLTPDEGLAAYRDRRVRREKADTKEIRNARAILDAISYVLRSDRGEDWRALERAWEALKDIAPPSDDVVEALGPAMIPKALDAPAPSKSAPSESRPEPSATPFDPTMTAPPSPPSGGALAALIASAGAGAAEAPLEQHRALPFRVADRAVAPPPSLFAGDSPPGRRDSEMGDTTTAVSLASLGILPETSGRPFTGTPWADAPAPASRALPWQQPPAPVSQRGQWDPPPPVQAMPWDPPSPPLSKVMPWDPPSPPESMRTPRPPAAASEPPALRDQPSSPGSMRSPWGAVDPAPPFRPPVPPEQPAQPSPPRSRNDTTTSELAVRGDVALPFQDSSGPPSIRPPASVRPPPPAHRSSRPPAEPGPPAFRTGDFGRAAAAPALEPPTPDLSLDQYAALCAHGEVHPERSAEANQRFGIHDTPTRQRVDAQWQARLADPDLRHRFYSQLAHYREWFRNHQES